MMRVILAAAIACALPFSGQAQDVPKAEIVAPAAPIDPQRLAAAEVLVARIMPAGIFDRVFDQMYEPMMEEIAGSIDELPLAKLAEAIGASVEDTKAVGDARLGEMMAVYDPFWRERSRRTNRALMEGIRGIMAKLEPAMRAAYARAYAREFTVAELTDLDRYFATPVGAHYAAKSLELGASPEITKVMGEMMPMVMEAMPGIMEKLEAATKDLPAPRDKEDLTPAELKRLGELFGEKVEGPTT